MATITDADATAAKIAYLTMMADTAQEAATTAFDGLGEARAIGHLTPHITSAAMKAQANNLPWIKVRREAAQAGVDLITAVRTVHAKLTDRITNWNESLSTCPIVNEDARMEREGIRAFLKATSKIAA